MFEINCWGASATWRGKRPPMKRKRKWWRILLYNVRHYDTLGMRPKRGWWVALKDGRENMEEEKELEYTSNEVGEVHLVQDPRSNWQKRAYGTKIKERQKRKMNQLRLSPAPGRNREERGEVVDVWRQAGRFWGMNANNVEEVQESAIAVIMVTYTNGAEPPKRVR